MKSKEPCIGATVEIVVPIRNERPALPFFMAALEKSLKTTDISYSILFVDDGSSDASWEYICNLARSKSFVSGIRFYRNFGKEAAIRAGLTASSADAVVVMDVDLQHPPELLPVMIQKWQRGALLVEAEKSSDPHSSYLRKLLNRILYMGLSLLGGVNLQGATDFKLLDRTVVDLLHQLPENTRFFRGLVSWLGVTPSVVFFTVPKRSAGNSRWHFLALLRLTVDLLTSFTSLPLRVVSLMSIIFLLGAAVLSIQTLSRYFLNQAVEGFTTVIICILLVGSVLAAGLGIIGEYVARIYEELKQRPGYLVRETCGTRVSSTVFVASANE